MSMMIQPGRFTVPGGGTAHRYWRLYITDNAGFSGTFTRINHIALAESAGGEKVNGSGTTVAANSLLDGSTTYQAANVNDNDRNTFWNSSGSAFPHTLTFDLGSGNEKDVREIRITADKTEPTAGPGDFVLQYSDDNATWFDHITVVGATTWLHPFPKSYRTLDCPESDGYLFYRVETFTVYGASAFAQSEIELRTALSGADITDNSTDWASASSTSAGQDPYKAIDNNSATWWASDADTTSYWQIELKQREEVVEISLQALGSGNYTYATKDGAFYGSNDGITWTQLFGWNNLSWTNSEVKVFHAATAHRYWRTFFLDNNGAANYIAVSRLQMYSSVSNGGARINMCTGGTILYDSQGGSGGDNAVNAFDDDNGTIWANGSGGNTNHYLGYDFTTPVVIDRFMLQTRSNNNDQMAKNIKLECSDDNATWTTVYTSTAQTAWGPNEERLFTLPSYAATYSGSPHGTHTYWRLHFAKDNAGTGFTYSAAEVEMRATAGGANQCTGGTATAHSTFGSIPGSFDPSKAFDANAATFWSANGASADGWLKYVFAAPVAVGQIRIQARNDGSYGQTPRYGMVEFSDDNVHWSVAWEYTMAATYSAGSAQNHTDPEYK